MTGFATGWYVIAFKEELASGQVLPLRYFDTRLVAFRGESGVVHVLDAHCPHLGADLGVGGTVVGGTVVEGGTVVVGGSVPARSSLS